MSLTIIWNTSLDYFDAAAYLHFPVTPSSQNFMESTVNGERNQDMNMKHALYTSLLF